MKHPHTVDYYRSVINSALPEGMVVPDHDENGHFYRVPHLGARYPSVNGRIHIFREEGLNDWRMNKALQYVFQNWHSFTEANIMAQLGSAEQQSIAEFRGAGDIGTDIHAYREAIFRDVIAGKNRFEGMDFHAYIPPEREDIRAISAMGALQKFARDFHYEPVATELPVYSERLQLGGMLDDIGLIWTLVRKGDPICVHEMVGTHCVRCDLKYRKELCLMDLKSSNQLKPIYWIQVGLYYTMFRALTGLAPRQVFILKLDKGNRTYTVEFIRDIGQVVRIAKRTLALADGLDWIKGMRKKQVEII